MAVLHPLKVILTDYPEDRVEELQVPNHPQDESMGTRTLPFSREVYIDRNDFREEAPKKFKRLVAGGEVRLRNAYVIRCDEVIKNTHGEIIELHCSHDEATLGANPEGRKVKGVIHWVSVPHAVVAEVRLYDRLFNHPAPDAVKDGSDYCDHLNPDSLRTLTGCMVEPVLAEAGHGENYQFEREGYFCVDTVLSSPARLVFNRTVTLRDSWAKLEQQQKAS
jgi:glutaminyl-tRNA synthetase